MQVDVGDRVTFNVQGAVMDTYVGSIRTVDWQRVQTNFLVVFPTGVLERAPQFHVLITRGGLRPAGGPVSAGRGERLSQRVGDRPETDFAND